MTFFLGLAGILGLLFGSFSTVLIDRWKNGKGGILMGRSECPKCHHRLSCLELIPLFSYIFQGGKCHSCKVKIPLFYPIAELVMSAIFVLITYVSLRGDLGFLTHSHILLLTLGFITGVYILYDLRYMEIPDEIMIPGIYGYLLLLIISLFVENVGTIFFDRFTYSESIDYFVLDHLMGAWILYTFLYIQILIPGGWHLASRGKMGDLLQLIASYVLFPFSLLLERFKYIFGAKKSKKPQTEEEDIPTWIGGGDLRIALFIGLTLGTIHGIASFAFAYIFGSIIGIGLILLGKIQKQSMTQIPFGPFLGAGWIMSVLFHDAILGFIEKLFY